MAEIVDNPHDWVAEHIRRFLATGGRPRPGVDDLLLTTRGRRTGTLRRTALTYVPDGNAFVVVASNAGADTHPAWYLNLVADPAVTVEVGVRRLAGTARTADAQEKVRLWRAVVATMPVYQRYQGMTRRDIPVVVIDHTPGSG